ncbi:glycosyltransferase family protein, partial [Klebsiella pneumoniae]
AWLSSIVDTRVIVLTLTENTGGAGGFKTGSQYICEQLASDWVFFYDDDAYPYPDTLKSFSQLDKRGCRVFSGLVKDPQGKPCPMNMPFSRVPTSLGDTVRYLRYPGEFIPAANRSMFVQTVSFVGMVIHRDLLATSLDYIREQLFIYFDDLYFGYQLSLAGEQIMYSPELLFYHDVSIQGKLIAPEWKVYYLCRNLILSKKIFQKNGVYSNSAIAIRILKYILILPWQRQKYSYMKFILRGISHGIKGISGKYH